ncbi:MAG: hypothetical protein M3N38_10650 [Pseudomonadota bacterium]|nr:hypothetical protein [Pseudomonadota bacterium]
MAIWAARAAIRTRTGVSSLAAETRRVVDHHQDFQVTARRNMSFFAMALLVALAAALVLLGATAQAGLFPLP